MTNDAQYFSFLMANAKNFRIRRILRVVGRYFWVLGCMAATMQPKEILGEVVA